MKARLPALSTGSTALEVVMHDRRLAAESRGVLGFFILGGNGPNVNVANLAAEFSTGRERMARIVNELVAAGYVERHFRRYGGAFAGVEYRLAGAIRERRK